MLTWSRAIREWSSDGRSRVRRRVDVSKSDACWGKILALVRLVFRGEVLVLFPRGLVRFVEWSWA